MKCLQNKCICNIQLAELFVLEDVGETGTVIQAKRR